MGVRAIALFVCLWGVGLAVVSATPQAPATGASGDAAPPSHGATIERYCVTCHNDRARMGDLTLQGLDPAQPGAAAATWEMVVRKLRTRTMPPPGSPRLADATYDALVTGLETQLDRTAAVRPNPGRPVLRRLNRTEYGNAIRDLLDLEVDIASYLPPDDAAFGFDNISDVLG